MRFKKWTLGSSSFAKTNQILSNNTEAERVLLEFRQRINQYIADGRLDQALVAAADVVQRSESMFGVDSLQTVGANVDQAMVHHARNEHNSAIELFNRFIPHLERLLPPDHATLPSALLALASSYCATGRTEEGRVATDKAISLLTASVGERHQDLAPALAQRGLILRQQGRISDSAHALEKARDIQKLHGIKDGSHASILSSLGALYLDMRRGADALALGEEALATCEGGQKVDERAFVSILTQLGAAHHSVDQCELAKQVFLRALAVCERNTPRLAEAQVRILSNLSAVHSKLGFLPSAKKYAIQALESHERLKNASPVQFALTTARLADVCREAGELQEAMSHYERCEALLESSGNADHPEALRWVACKAEIEVAQGNIVAAETRIRAALAARYYAVHQNSTALLPLMIQLGHVYLEKGRLIDSLALCEQALSIVKTLQVPPKQDLEQLAANSAYLKFKIGDFAGAELRTREALAVRETMIADKHGDDKTYYWILAMICARLGRLSEARMYIDKNLDDSSDGRTAADGLSDVVMLTFATALMSSGRLTEAQEICLSELSRKETGAPAGTSSDLAILYHCLGSICVAKGELGKACVYVERASVECKSQPNSSHAVLVQVLHTLREIYRKLGRMNDAARVTIRLQGIERELSKHSDPSNKGVLCAITNRALESAGDKFHVSGNRSELLYFVPVEYQASLQLVAARAQRRAQGFGLLDQGIAPLSSESGISYKSEGPCLFSDRVEMPEEVLPVIIFIHGFSNSFDDSVVRAAQIAFDLEWTGHFFLFSWPSMGRPDFYTYDKESAEMSIEPFARMLSRVRSLRPSAPLHIIAHSMGSVVALGGLKEAASFDMGQVADEVVVAHPDIEPFRFRAISTNLKGRVGSITVYDSPEDRALRAARAFNRRPQEGSEILTADGVHSIDVSGLGEGLFDGKHGVYAANPIVFGDISRIFRTRIREPRNRSSFFIEAQTKSGQLYWRYA